MTTYVSWRPDPGAEYVDAFLVDWQEWFFYAFPPFCLIGRCLSKIISDKAEGILVVPKWATQPWFSTLLKLLIADPLIFPVSTSTLCQPETGETHPLTGKLYLMSCRLSGEPSKVQAYQSRLLTSYYPHGGSPQKLNTRSTQEGGWTFAVCGKLISCTHL